MNSDKRLKARNAATAFMTYNKHWTGRSSHTVESQFFEPLRRTEISPFLPRKPKSASNNW